MELKEGLQAAVCYVVYWSVHLVQEQNSTLKIGMNIVA
jgi:hypothetical protein